MQPSFMVCASNNAPRTQVTISIDKTGAVSTARVAANVPLATQQCLEARFKEMKFDPPPQVPVVIIAPVMFLQRKPPPGE